MKLRLVGVSCVLLALMVSTLASADETVETELRKMMPQWFNNIVDFFCRMKEFETSADNDKVIQQIKTLITNGDAAIISGFGECILGGFFQYLTDNKETELGQLGEAFLPNENSAKQYIEKPSKFFAVIPAVIMKLSDGSLHWDQFGKEFLNMFVTDIPRYCSRTQVGEYVKSIEDLITSLSEIGWPWQSSSASK